MPIGQEVGLPEYPDSAALEGQHPLQRQERLFADAVAQLDAWLEISQGEHHFFRGIELHVRALAAGAATATVFDGRADELLARSSLAHGVEDAGFGADDEARRRVLLDEP